MDAPLLESERQDPTMQGRCFVGNLTASVPGRDSEGGRGNKLDDLNHFQL